MKRIILYIVLSVFLFFACNKVETIPVQPNTEDCLDLVIPENILLTYFSSERFQYKKPSFNPNNNNEFIYYYTDNLLNEYKLIKYNLKTNVKKTLVKDIIIVTQPKWSRNGWIAFDNLATYQTSIINDNGDSLLPFGTNVASIFPTWDATGQNLYYQHSPVLGNPYYLFKQNLSTKVIDTIMYPNDENNGYSIYNDISIDNKLISQVGINNQMHIGFTDLYDFSFKSLVNLETDNLLGLTGLCWSNNSIFAYFTVYQKGMYKIDISSGVYELLFEFCGSKQYQNISCSADGTKLIAERVDSYLVKNDNGQPTGQIIQNSSIYIIDLLLLTETKINL